MDTLPFLSKNNLTISLISCVKVTLYKGFLFPQAVCRKKIMLARNPGWKVSAGPEIEKNRKKFFFCSKSLNSQEKAKKNFFFIFAIVDTPRRHLVIFHQNLIFYKKFNFFTFKLQQPYNDLIATLYVIIYAYVC